MNDKLDKLLQDWSSQAEPDPAHLDRLAARISHARSQPRPDGAVFGASAPRRAPGLDRLVFAGLGAAAAAAALLLLYFTCVRRPAPHQEDPLRGLAVLSPSDLDASTVLFEEVNGLFAGRLAWIVSSERAEMVHLQEEYPPGEAEAQVILIRTVLACRRANEDRWRKAWSADVFVRDEGFVAAKPEGDPLTSVDLWVYKMPDGELAVESNLVSQTPLPLAFRSIEVLTPGKPSQVLMVKTKDAEYRLFQVGCILRAPGGGKPAHVL